MFDIIITIIIIIDIICGWVDDNSNAKILQKNSVLQQALTDAIMGFEAFAGRGEELIQFEVVHSWT